jgi:uncharacterized protein YciW
VSVTTSTVDVIDRILGSGSTGRIAEIRRQKPELAAELQAYYESIFAPTETSARALPLTDRHLVAVRVASFTRSAAVVEWYSNLATAAGVSADLIARSKEIATPWTDASALGAAIRHTDLLTTRPSDARQSDLQALKEAGFTPAGILSLSQTIAFVSYQLRLIAGLRAFGEAS